MISVKYLEQFYMTNHESQNFLSTGMYEKTREFLEKLKKIYFKR